MRPAPRPLLALSAAAGLVAVLLAHAASLPATKVVTPPVADSRRQHVASHRPPAHRHVTKARPNGTASGSLEQYGYGELSVRVTERDGRIVSVTVPTLRTAESYSQQLAQSAIPRLQSEVLSAQSAQISAVGGATYTSEAYISSLQSALDQLKKS